MHRVNVLSLCDRVKREGAKALSHSGHTIWVIWFEKIKGWIGITR